MGNLTRGLIALAALAATSLTLAPGAHAADDATVSVLHAIPGAVVDVYANGQPLLTDFKPGTLTDPMAVPAGANITVVAHLSASGKPALTPYVNDTSPIAAGQTRLTVRHAAAAPAVDVRAGGTPVFTDLANPGED